MKTEIPLKPVRLENGAGQNLEICTKCFGTGTHYQATRLVDNGSGGTRQELADLREGEVKAHKKHSWVIHPSPCQTCKGAGMALSDKERV